MPVRPVGETTSDPRMQKFAMVALAFALFYFAVMVPAFVGQRPSVGVLAVWLLLGIVLVALSVIDFRVQRLPDILTLPLIAAGLLFCLVADPPAFAWHLLAALCAYLLLYLFATVYERLRSRPGLGLGDAKLLAAAGAWLGLEALPSVLLVATGTALFCVGMAVLLGKRITATSRIPFGPFLATAFWIVWLYGPMD